jgi:phage-related protein
MAITRGLGAGAPMTSALRARHATPSIVSERSSVAMSGVAPAVTNQPSGVRSAWSGPAAPVATSSSAIARRVQRLSP